MTALGRKRTLQVLPVLRSKRSFLAFTGTILKAMNVDAISARVDNDGTNMVKRIKIEHWNDRRNCRLYPSGLLIDEVARQSLLPVAPYIYL